MTSHRTSWLEAIKANRQMVLDRRKGEQVFQRLIDETGGEDGMVFYERGEAHEHLGELGQAAEDFKTAEIKLPLPGWKEVARIAQARVKEKHEAPGRRSVVPPQWDAFHRIHGMPTVPNDFRMRALSAISRLDSQPDDAVATFRWCLERVVDTAIGLPRGGKKLNLFKRIRSLEGKVPERVFTAMGALCEKGNDAVHDEIGAGTDRWLLLEHFMEVLEWTQSEFWDPKYAGLKPPKR